MNKLILIVDDQVNNLHLLGKILTGNDYQIIAAESGESALKYLEKTLPDLILLDIVMPNMNGIELCKKIKSDKRWVKIPIIFVTIDSDQEMINRAFLAGGADYLTRPYKSVELLARMAVHLELAGKQKQIEHYLNITQKQLEAEITKKTEAADILSHKNSQLEDMGKQIDDTNIALKVLLNQREKDSKNLEIKILKNVNDLILPHLESLSKAPLNVTQTAHLEVIKDTLEQLTSSFTQKITEKYLKLTPTEMEVVSYINLRKSSKEIADVMNLAKKTIDNHRQNIRKKFNLEKSGRNLESFLRSLS